MPGLCVPLLSVHWPPMLQALPGSGLGGLQGDGPPLRAVGACCPWCWRRRRGVAGKQALSSFFLRSHVASHKCCLFHVGSGLFFLGVASESPGKSLHGHSRGHSPHLLGLPPGLCGQVDPCGSMRGSASPCRRAGGLGLGPVLTFRSLSSSLTMWWAPGVTGSALGLGTPWVSSPFRRPLPRDPVCDVHLGCVWRDSPHDFRSHTCALASDRWLCLPEELPMPHLRLNLSWPASEGEDRLGGL